MRVGLILGGGGEVGIAWEIGVLAALEKEARFSANACEVIAGTSAGAIVGAYVAQGHSVIQLAALDRARKGRPFGGDLIESKAIDAIVFIGLILPILANNNEQKTEREKAAGGRLRTATVTGGPLVAGISEDLLDHSARVRAVQVGVEDGRQAA